MNINHWNSSEIIYSELNWDNFPPIVKIPSPGDGNCLFHSILAAFFIPYITEKLEDGKISKNYIVMKLRKELSMALLEPDPISPHKTKYDTLLDGQLKDFNKSIKHELLIGTYDDFSCENMIKVLNSNQWIGFGYLHHISRELHKDIYILDYENKTIFKSYEDSYIRNNENSIVILYDMKCGHFDLIGFKDLDGNIITYFNPDHSLIKFLKKLSHSSK